MGTRASSGFTIIETVLFLGVTGLLVLGVLIGVGANVNIQRYRDATTSFKSDIQGLYSNVSNVQNGRANDFICNSAAGVVQNAAGEIPGQSNCVIAGKYMRITGNTMNTYTVLARERAGVTPSDGSDITALREKYTLNVSSAEVVTKEMEWGTEIARPIVGGVTTGRTPHALAFLVVRSPESGQVYTFTSTSVPTDQFMRDLNPATPPAFLTAMLSRTNQVARTVCIESSGLFGQGQMALFLNSYASSTNAVELVSNDTLQARGSSSSC